MKVVGHTLVWHRQTPAWVFEGKDGRAADRETLLARLREHILAVVGRYKGRIHGWDVVNEAIDEDGTWRKTKWHEILGDDLVAKAFEYAHEADPQAELYYNDFNLWIPAKRQAALRVVKDLRARGLRVDGVGEQGHYLLDRPPLDQVEAAITDIAAAGLKVMITELDVDVLPRPEGTFGADLERQQKLRAETDIYREGLPEAKQQELARRYADLVGLFVAHRDKVTRITLWGVTDAQTWLNNFPMRGRVNHALLWDRSARPKPAFDAVARALAKR
jgi:endo-1,4-beta-xylanase